MSASRREREGGKGVAGRTELAAGPAADPGADPAAGPAIRYEVRARVAPHRAEAYASYLRDEHIPDLMATGCFLEAEFCRIADGATDPEGRVRFRSSYLAPDARALDRYLAEHAPRLRAHALERVPDGLELEREVWAVVDHRLPASRGGARAPGKDATSGEGPKAGA